MHVGASLMFSVIILAHLLPFYLLIVFFQLGGYCILNAGEEDCCSSCWVESFWYTHKSIGLTASLY